MKKTFRSIIALTLSLLMVFGYAGTAIIGFAVEPCADDAHVWDIDHPVETAEATDTACGYAVYECLSCGATKKDIIHSDRGGVAVETEPATCKEPGERRYSCAVCGEDVIVEIPTLPHNLYVSKTVQPTCTDDGYYELSCANEGCQYTEGVVSKDANGYIITQEVQVDGQPVNVPVNMSVPISALGHNENGQGSEIPATCDKAGVKTTTCSRCGTPFTKIIPATNHELELDEALSPATCCQEGVAKYRCKHTNIKFDEEGKPVKNAETGEYEYEICEYYEYKPIDKDPNAHKWDEGTVTQEGDCTTPQITVYTCTCEDNAGNPCGKTNTVTDPVAGHNYSDLTWDPNGNCYTSYCDKCTSTVNIYPEIVVEFNKSVVVNGAIDIMHGNTDKYTVSVVDRDTKLPIKGLAVTDIATASTSDADVVGFVKDPDTGLTVDGTISANAVGTATLTFAIQGKETVKKEITVNVTGKTPVTVKAFSDAKNWNPGTDYNTMFYDINSDQKIDRVLTFSDKTEGEKITLPSHEIYGYNFEGWSVDGAEPVKFENDEYTVPGEDVVLQAIYTLETYYAAFLYEDGKEYAKSPYTVEDGTVDEPAVPVKVGYKGVWDQYVLSYTNDPAEVTKVKPVYTVSASLSIVKNPGEARMDYGKCLKLHADTGFYSADGKVLVPEGMQIAWFVNGVYKGSGDSFLVEFIAEDETVEVCYVPADKENPTSADQVEVEINGVPTVPGDKEYIKVTKDPIKCIIGFFLKIFNIRIGREQPSRGTTNFR